MDLKAYTLEELESYLRPRFADPHSSVALSPLRLASYLLNPRAEAKDPVLFELRREGELLAYRTLLPDCFFNRDGLPHRFAWLSGNWVRPDMRRKGLSSRLLKMAEEQWQGHLMYTNYAPASKALYDNSGRFRLLTEREGTRFYLRSATEELLGKRLGSKKLLHAADQLVNQLREGSINKFYSRLENSCKVEHIQDFSGAMATLVNKMQRESLFRRDSQIFNWALEHPWLSQESTPPLLYHFSYQVKHFENILIRFSHPVTRQQGLSWLVIHNRVLSVPYLFFEDKSLLPCIASTIVKNMIDQDCTHMTLRHPELLASMKPFRSVFLSTRLMPQLVFAHKKLRELLPEQAVMQDGDGDVMFTG